MARRTNAYYQDEWPLFPANEPEGIYQTQNIPHHFEEVLRIDGPAREGGFILRSTFQVAENAWDESLGLWSETDALLEKSDGVVSACTYRGVDNPEGALRLLRLRSREDLEALVVRPDLVAVEMKLAGLAQPLAYPELNIFEAECFEVADEYAGH
jgi:hypothetical protein